MGFLKRMKEKHDEKIAAQEETQRIADEKQQKLILKYKTESLDEKAGKIDDLILKPKEYCYLAVSNAIAWQEDRKVRTSVSYSGLSTSIHIAKGVNFRMGSFKPSSTTTDELKTLFIGAPFLTNKRIILVNDSGIKGLMLSNIVGIKPYSNAVELFRNSGKRIVLTGFDDATEFNIFLSRILNNDFEGHQSIETTTD